MTTRRPTHPSRTTRQDIDDGPNGFVWADEERVPHWSCVTCGPLRIQTTRSLANAWISCRDHLWATHALRRCWIANADPAYELAVQQALPLAIAHNTTRFDA